VYVEGICYFARTPSSRDAWSGGTKVA
jgi:hypothetical protein